MSKVSIWVVMLCVVQVSDGSVEKGRAVFYKALQDVPWAKVSTSIPNIRSGNLLGTSQFDSWGHD